MNTIIGPQPQFLSCIIRVGSSSGIGAGTAVHFAKLGAKVVVNGRDPKRVASVAQECRNVTANPVLEVVVDLQDDSQTNNLVHKTIDTFGKIDVLVNCAGIIGQKAIHEPDYQELFDTIVKINLRSVVYLTSLVVPHLESTNGCIVNVSSVSSVTPWKRTWSAYGMTKCGLDMFTKCLAMELGPKGIRVNSILPGIVLTPMIGGTDFNEDLVKMFCQTAYPMGRPGYVDDMVRAIEFLASDSSSFITGISMPIDGGAICVYYKGSSSGIGAGTAVHFAKLGAKVVVNGRDPKKVAAVAQECRKVSKNPVLEAVVDIQDDNQAKSLVQKTIDTFGKINVLVNCAGVMGQKAISDHDYMELFDHLMPINLRSVVLLTSLVVPYLEITKGCIVNVSSIGSVTPWKRRWTAYGMTKCGLDMLTKCLAMELGPKGIRVNSIQPGIVITPMVNGTDYDEETVKMYCESAYPLGRPGYVNDIVRSIEFLASDESSFITGASAGVGQKFAQSLAKLGFKLVITGRDPQKLKDVAQSCRQLSNDKVLEVKTDLLNDEELAELMERTIKEFGRLDVLANCAQISIPCSKYWK
ncbi:unnamed protein product [Medioppia subpectinata]|uniref:Uncharacterized protein n=1 Tax=Medioppia subpectinata TaxID=1979941 RepID=A0A7R9KTY2_9ACAR|nr:unnamed protein product [Medioppia subpectinata]CAG2109418.1 unnamed protein product [Medioppia subpectinata]